MCRSMACMSIAPGGSLLLTKSGSRAQLSDTCSCAQTGFTRYAASLLLPLERTSHR